MEITTQELKEKIESGEKILVDFFTLWCGPCKAMKPYFEQVANEFNSKDGVKLYLFNVEKDKEYAVNVLGVRGVPTIKGFKGGSEVYSKTGIHRKDELINVINSI